MTLTQVATFTRRFIIFAILSLIIGISSFLGYKIWYAHYLASLPPVEIKPDVNWGVLSAPKFTQNNTTTVSSSNFSYSIDTVTGNLPTFDKIMKVFYMPKSVATLLSADRSRSIADKMQLTADPNILSPTLYQYQDNTRQLTVDLDSGNFKYNMNATPSATQTLVDTDTTLIADFKEFLRSMNVLNPDLQNGPSKVNYFKFDGGNLVPANSAAEAQAAQINLWPANLDGKPILTSTYNQSLVNAMVINSAKDPNNYISINFTYWPVDASSFSTYPIKTSDQALADLKGGQGTVIVAPNNPNVSITSTSIAYFQPADYIPYLQPIYVFEGPGFVALVPAVTSQYLTPNP